MAKSTEEARKELNRIASLEQDLSEAVVALSARIRRIETSLDVLPPRLKRRIKWPKTNQS